MSDIPGLPPHPGFAHTRALELAYDGAIPPEAMEGARQADWRAHDAWTKQTKAALIRHALQEAYDALKDTSDNAFMRRAAAAGIVSAVLSRPEFQEAAA
jgi:hypothetical protein